jgi:hypothetical protein
MRTVSLFAIPFVFALAAAPALVAGERPTDAQVVAEIQNKLYRARVPQHGDVQVTFSNGTATLTGAVDSVGMKVFVYQPESRANSAS